MNKLRIWKQAALLISGALMISGCMVQSGNRQLDDPNAINQIEKGKSTKDDVRRLIGSPPVVTFNDKNEEIWTYLRYKMSQNAASCIPCVGLFAGQTSQEQTQVTVKYDTNGVVNAVGCGTSQEKTRPIDAIMH